MSESTCVRCDKVATFCHPENFCDEHWARWWGGFDPTYPYGVGHIPSQEMYEEAIKNILEKFGRSDG